MIRIKLFYAKELIKIKLSHLSCSYQANEIYIDLPYKIYRLGFFSTNFYDIYDKEFHNISFLEKANGVFFEQKLFYCINNIYI